MIEFKRPSIETVEQNESGSYGKFEVEPLERGFGITLVIGFRRVPSPAANIIDFIKFPQFSVRDGSGGHGCEDILPQGGLQDALRNRQNGAVLPYIRNLPSGL